MSEAFRPTCSTYVLIADATAPIGIRGERQVGGYGLVQIQFMNIGNDLAYIGYGSTPEEAQGNAVVPTAGNPKYVMPIFPRCAVAHSFAPGTYFSGIASDATTILITDGEGAYGWVGVTSEVPMMLSHVVGGYSWAGTTSNLPLLVAAGVGAYSWVGADAVIVSIPTIAAEVGAYGWTGTNSVIPVLVGAEVGAYSWQGTTSTTSQLLDLNPGQFAWAGTQSEVPALINAAIGAYTWQGTQAYLPITTYMDSVIRDMKEQTKY